MGISYFHLSSLELVILGALPWCLSEETCWQGSSRWGFPLPAPQSRSQGLVWPPAPGPFLLVTHELVNLDLVPFQASFAPMEDKLNQAHIEVQQLKASVKNYEGMIDNYKSQVGCPVPAALPGQQRLLLWREVHPKASPQKGVFWFFFHQNLALPKMAQCFVGPQVMKTRLEADEVAAQLERCDKENKILKDEMNTEIEAVLLPVLAFFPSPVPGLPGLSLLSVLDALRCASHLVFLSPVSSLFLFLILVFLKKKNFPCLEHSGGFRSTDLAGLRCACCMPSL